MRILMVHNRYQHPGGEDSVFEAEVAVLRDNGHEVVTFQSDNREIAAYSMMQRVGLAGRAVWSRKTAHGLDELIKRRRPDIAHFHNTFPLISPAAYWTCDRAGIPVVQTLHNYRLICAAATLFRNGTVCEKCVGMRAPWGGVRHGCYRDSRSQSAVLTAVIRVHHGLATWREKVTTYVALSEFGRRKFVEGGLPADRIVVKPNFLADDPDEGTDTRDYVLYVGRLTPEKGIATLLEAWQGLARIPLHVVGDGPLADEVRRKGRALGPHVAVLGPRSRKAVLGEMQRAAVLVVPSLWYECFPMTILEAYACGTPVVASRIGSLTEVVQDAVSGLLVSPGEPNALASAIRRLWDDEVVRRRLGSGARRLFSEQYTKERGYSGLLGVYDATRARHRAKFPKM